MIFNPVYVVRTKVNFVDYIASSGTQYIDTDFVPDENTKVVCDFQLLSASSNNECIFGVAGQFSFRWFGSDSTFRSNGGNNVDFGQGVPEVSGATARLTVEKTATTCFLHGAGEDEDYVVTNTAGTVTKSLYLFAHNGNSVTNYASVKIYSLQIYAHDVLVRDYQPCLDENGVACFYEKITQKYVYNAGTGEFTSP